MALGKLPSGRFPPRTLPPTLTLTLIWGNSLGDNLPAGNFIVSLKNILEK